MTKVHGRFALAEIRRADACDTGLCLAPVGAAVTCAVCGQRKQPTGRDAPLGSYLCNSHDCPGWREPPCPGDLWPGEERQPAVEEGVDDGPGT